MTDSPRTRPARPTRGPSMGDVAALAQVSSQTVSRVANGLTNVDEKTRQRVLDAMQTIGYRPNKAARALRLGKTLNVGIIIHSVDHFGTARTLEAIAEATAAIGYSISLVTVDGQDAAAIGEAFERLLEQRVDGMVIVTEADVFERSGAVIPSDVSVVFIDGLRLTDHSRVDNDQEGGARAATEHLLDLGHANVRFISGPGISANAAAREASWRETLVERGIEPLPVLRGDWSAESAYELALTLLADRSVTAVFAANDAMALGVLRAAHELGRDVPGDLSVVGFDNVMEAASFWPPLTTIRQDFTAVGRATVALLMATIDAPSRPTESVIVPTELVVRKSTGPAPTA